GSLGKSGLKTSTARSPVSISTHTMHAERTMFDRSKACSKAGSWPEREQLVGLISCSRLARSWAGSGQVRGRAQATKLGRRQPRPGVHAPWRASSKTSSELGAEHG